MKKIRFIMFVSALLICMGILAFGANTKDRTWSFSNKSTVSYTGSEIKIDSTNVYVYPITGQTLQYKVQKLTSTSTFSDARTSYAKIPIGVQATMRSSAGSGSTVRIKIYNTKTYNSGTTTGVWSPDSTDYYTVY